MMAKGMAGTEAVFILICRISNLDFVLGLVQNFTCQF